MKKFMTIIAAAMLVLALTGCDTLGKGKTKGTKWKKTMTVDGTSITTKYRRFIKPLSTSKKVTAIKTTIAVDTDKSILKSDTGKAVVGLAIDFHSEGTTKKTYDMVLIGFQPEGKMFYIEKYENVSESADNKDASYDDAIDEETEDLGDNGFDTSASSMNGDAHDDYVPYKSFYDSANKTTFTKAVTLGEYEAADWMAAPAGSYNADGDEGFEIYVQVKQTTKGTYEIYLGNTKVATYSGEKKDNDGNCIGGAAVYANTPKGTKVTVKYISDKDETNGLFADEEDF